MAVNLAEGHQKPALCAHQDLKVPWGNIRWASRKAWWTSLWPHSAQEHQVTHILT